MTTNVTVTPSDGGEFPSGLPGDRLIRGTFARWNETSGWTDRDGLPLPETMLIIGYTTVLQKWKDGKAEVKSAHPLPDPKVLNNEIPVAEWELDLAGKPTEPWKLTYVIYMIESEDRGDLHLRELHVRRHARLQQSRGADRCDAYAPRRACVSDRAFGKTPNENAVRDEDTPAPAHSRLARTKGWRRRP